ncbi:MAG TPA: sodium-dependent transporter [Bacteroidales bacterium]|nr:sodium-dependent transporter [Bacteroidales bacterium]
MAFQGNGSRENFGTKFGIICAAAGSAIGLGNIWRFPYIAGEYGGGAFLVVYLAIILVLGIPVMLSEFIIGRRGQMNTFGTFRKLAPGKAWWIIGVMGIVAAFVILAFYTTISGWTLAYIAKSVGNVFQGSNAAEISLIFDEFHTSTFWPLFWQGVFMLITVLIVFAGVKKGIETYNKFLMPLLALLLLIIAFRSVTLPGAGEGLRFLFFPDFSKINADVIFAALGQAFFSLSVGMGAMITYGSYINKRHNLTTIATQVPLADTFIATLAGVAIFPAVFAFGLYPGEGPGLVFLVLPQVFLQMPGGHFISILFFVLLAIAALTSAISILEVVVAFLMEEFKLPRKRATIMASVSALFVGVFSTLSFGVLSQYTIGNYNFFGILDFTASKVMLPLGGLLIVIFLGWVMKASDVKDELSNGGIHKIRLFDAFWFIIRFIAPVAISIIFLNSVGLI